MIVDWLQAIVLGVLQGLTEFIPVSSSGHLVLVPYVLGWPRPGLAFDVALHAGTAGAIVLYFRVELAGMARAVLRGGGTRESRLYRRMVLLLAVASLPVAVVGLALEDLVEQLFATPPVAASMLLVTAAVLAGGEKVRERRVAAASPAPAPAAGDGEAAAAPDWSEGTAAAAPVPDERDVPVQQEPDVPVGADPSDPTGKDLENVGVREALTIGAAQIFALLPGMSRSGTTIMAGVAVGMTREAATRFSFLMALPALVGASIVSLPDLGNPGPYSGGAIAAAVVAAFLSGYAAIAFLVRLVARTSLTVFVRYLVLAAALGLLASATLGPPSTV
ncbi:MAG TPA: undecaprenyl-diphosphate phosphatase [Egibacteraceae bacterium]|nr:undecaprenyl-diphosphate phosphatase [Egibacteraceae bacterium]